MRHFLCLLMLVLVLVLASCPFALAVTSTFRLLPSTLPFRVYTVSAFSVSALSASVQESSWGR